jgi:hypothetical protein
MNSLQLKRKVKKHGIHNYNIHRGKRTTMSRAPHYSSKPQEITFKSISKDDAKDQIRRYITQHPEGSLTSQIIEALRIDPITTVDTLEELKHEGLVLNQAIE